MYTELKPQQYPVVHLKPGGTSVLNEARDTSMTKKCVFLMGPPRVTKSQAPGAAPLRLSERADAMELLALLILAREFGAGDGAKDEGEVRRDWLLQTLFPNAATSRKERDRLVYLLNGDLGLEKALGIRARDAGRREMKRELNVIRLTFSHLWIDAWRSPRPRGIPTPRSVRTRSFV